MHLFFRTFLHILLSLRRSRVGLWGSASVPMRVWPADVDVALHINNGMYFSLMDLGRIDLMLRAGAWQRMMRRRWSQVISAETIAFRKSLKLWQSYTMETRLLGHDKKAFYFEQRMVAGGEVYARAIMAVRFVSKGRPVPMEDLLAEFGAPPADLELPAWVHDWRVANALPGSRRPAPHRWG